MREVFNRPYAIWIVGIFVVYMAANVLISQFYATARYIPYYLDTIKWEELLLSSLLSLTIGMLIAINSVYSYIKFQERKNIGKERTMTCAAAVGGFATGICPACVASVFPLIFGIVGVSFSWAALPFNGMEIQLLMIVILGISLYFLKRK